MTMRRRLVLAVSSAALLLGCASEETGPAPTEPASCADPVELLVPDGSCIRPGIPPDGCADGFEHDGEYGCEPILPAEPCPPGLMAVPGDTDCRPVMPCGQGRWGDIPVDATTEYVDGSYTGGGSDGSEALPWTTSGEAVAAAAPGALVAVARGTYPEEVVVESDPVRIWGVCPDEVAIVATGQNPPGACPPAALCIGAGADGTEVRGVALSGNGLAVAVSGSEQVLFDRVWVHDAAGRGISAEAALGPTSLTVRGSLVEQNHQAGLFVMASEATIEGSVVRTTLPTAPDQPFARGIDIQGACVETDTGPVCDPAARATVTVVGSVVEQNHDVGLRVSGSDATVEASVVRTTVSAGQARGRGISIQVPCDVVPTGIACDTTARANVVVTGSLVEQNHEYGLYVAGSDVTVEASVVRATWPRASDQRFGRGISIEVVCIETPTGWVCDPSARGTATVRRSLIEQSHDIGLSIGGSDAVVEASVVRATSPCAFDQAFGRGISLHIPCFGGGLGCDPSARASATLSGSLVEQNHEVGLFVLGSDASIDALVVRATSAQASNGLFGDGIAVASDIAPATAALARVRIDDSDRAGLSNFGASVSLGATRIGCAAFALAGEPLDGQDFHYEDRGDNLCGCPSADGDCKAVSAGLSPPEPVSGTD